MELRRWAVLGLLLAGGWATLVLPPGTPPDVEHDARDLIHFGAEVPLPVLSFRIGYHFG